MLKHMNQLKWLLAGLLQMYLLLEPARASQELTIYTVNYPLAYFAKRIAGDQARVVFPAPSDVDPAFWEPDLETIRAYQQADLILLNGAGYAHWVGKTSLPGLRTVDTSRKFRDQLIESEPGVSHSHGSGEAHSDAGRAFTTWLDISLAVEQARAIAEALNRKLPQQTGQFDRNFQALKTELEQLDRQIETAVAKLPSRPLLASHFVYQYLARRYQLELRSLSWEPGEVPEPSEWQALKNLLSDYQANWMIWEAKPVADTANRLKSMGINYLVYQPIGNRPATGDFISVMRDNLVNLEQAFD